MRRARAREKRCPMVGGRGRQSSGSREAYNRLMLASIGLVSDGQRKCISNLCNEVKNFEERETERERERDV